MIKLEVSPVILSIQWRFEHKLESMNIKRGCFAFVEEDNRYCNEHIQWLWEQFSKEFN